LSKIKQFKTSENKPKCEFQNNIIPV